METVIDMADTTRAFLALTLPAAMVDQAAFLQDELVSQIGKQDVKWVKPELFHITLRFFGDLSQSELDRVSSVLRTLSGNIHAIEISWSHLGAFPSRRKPQVFWLGLSDPGQRLDSLADKVTSALLPEGFGLPDKPFRAHVTLGRVRARSRVSFPDDSNRLTIPDLAFSIGTITLMKSLLTPRGPVYTPIETAQVSV